VLGTEPTRPLCNHRQVAVRFNRDVSAPAPWVGSDEEIERDHPSTITAIE